MTNHPSRTTKNRDDDGNLQSVTRTVQATGVVSRTVREDDDEDREVLRVPISSTREDREGDAFSEDDLRQRAEQIRSEKPMVFDDHGAVSAGLFGGGYSARETIGTQFDAEVEEGDDGHHTLYAYINPDGTHEEGERMLRQVRDEAQALKFSVGFRILQSSEDVPEGDRPDRANEIPGRLFMQTDLMETSRVGIPANTDASAGVAAKQGGMPGVGMQGMHPSVAARLFGLDGSSSNAPELKTDGGNPEDPFEGLRSEIRDLRSEVQELREDDEDGDDDDDDEDDDEEESGKDSCEVDTDCPEGEVCLEGECVPEDEVGDEEEESAELAELREEISEIRSAISEGVGSPESKDTDVTPESATPDTGKDNPDSGETENGAESTESDEQPKTAMDLARGN